MKPQTFSCLIEKITDDLKATNRQQEIIKNILWERVNFAIHALKNKTLPPEKIIESLESTIKKVQDLETICLDEYS